MFGYVSRKLLHAIATVFGVVLLTFVLFSVIGGDVAAEIAGRVRVRRLSTRLLVSGDWTGR